MGWMSEDGQTKAMRRGEERSYLSSRQIKAGIIGHRWPLRGGPTMHEPTRGTGTGRGGLGRES